MILDNIYFFFNLKKKSNVWNTVFVPVRIVWFARFLNVTDDQVTGTSGREKDVGGGRKRKKIATLKSYSATWWSCATTSRRSNDFGALPYVCRCLISGTSVYVELGKTLLRRQKANSTPPRRLRSELLATSPRTIYKAPDRARETFGNGSSLFVPVQVNIIRYTCGRGICRRHTTEIVGTRSRRSDHIFRTRTLCTLYTLYTLFLQYWQFENRLKIVSPLFNAVWRLLGLNFIFSNGKLYVFRKRKNHVPVTLFFEFQN